MTACGTYTKGEAAKRLGVSVATIDRRLAAGSLPRVHLGGRAVRLPAAVIDRLAAGESTAATVGRSPQWAQSVSATGSDDAGQRLSQPAAPVVVSAGGGAP